MNNNIAKNVDTKVLIIGGGITGLTAALFLLQQGVRCVVVERHKGTSVHPRSRGFDIRTMELFRGLKLGEAIREAGKALGPAWGILRGSNLVQTLAAQEEQTKEKVMFPSQMKSMQQLATMTPESGSRCTQDLVEPLLLNEARQRGAEILFNHEMISYEENENSITALIKDRANGATINITAGYMIAADGAKSPIREKLNAPVTGQGVIADFLNIYFEADLADLVKGREFSLFLINEPHLTGFLTSINNTNRWVFQLRYHPEKGEKPGDFSAERIIGILKDAIGIQDISIHIINVLPWEMTVKVVEQMQYGKIFLAGDAAHTMTPYGGKGANCGVQDVQNLAWKLGLVLKDLAGERLLESYTRERQPIGLFYALRSGEMADEYGLVKDRVVVQQMKNFIGIPDFQYASSAVINGQTVDQHQDGAPLLNGAAGTRLPHLWLNETKDCSTLDLIQNEFLLIGYGSEQLLIKLAEHINDRFRLPIHSYCFKDEAYISKWIELTGMTGEEMLLVRPDGFIAWRGVLNNPPDVDQVITKILSI